MSELSGELTSDLNAARAGDREAAERALGQVYRELKRRTSAAASGCAPT